jgi:hypothetical protein
VKKLGNNTEVAAEVAFRALGDTFTALQKSVKFEWLG